MIIIVKKARVNQAKILSDVHEIRDFAWRLIAVGHNLCGREGGTSQTEAMTQILL